MRDRLADEFGADVELVRGSKGAFEITVDGNLRFSKIATGRFPTDAEVDALPAD